MSRSPLVASLLGSQMRSGMVSWFPGGHADPWNHVEAAMALEVAGEPAAADAAYGWLIDTQRPDGSWPAYTAADGSIEEARSDTNACSYLAMGLLHRYHSRGDLDALAAAFPTLDAALCFVLGARQGGELVPWSVSEDGEPASFALLAATSSVVRSLGAAVEIAGTLDEARPEWQSAQGELARSVRWPGDRFLDKGEFAMDWYYPVLSGALTAEEGRDRLAARWDEFVIEGAGVLCRSDRRWVTTAESAELALALVVLGGRSRAERLLEALSDKEAPGGGYLTGLVYPERSSFPTDEVSSYSAAAVLLACDALAGGVTAGLFAPATRLSTRSEPLEEASSAVYEPLKRAAS